MSRSKDLPDPVDKDQHIKPKPPNVSESGIGLVIEKIEESVIALLFAAMTLVTFSQVIARYVFNAGAVWALEATTYLFAWLVLFGAAYGVKKNAHLGVDFVVKKFDSPMRRLLGMIAVSAALLYAGLLFWGGLEYVTKLYKIGIDAEDIPLPRWIFMSILPIGLGLVFVRFLQIGMRILHGKQDGLILGDETAEAMARHLEEVARDGRAERLKSGKSSA